MFASKINDDGEIIGPYDVLADDNTGTVVDFIKGSPVLTSKSQVQFSVFARQKDIGRYVISYFAKEIFTEEHYEISTSMILDITKDTASDALFKDEFAEIAL